MTAENAAMIDKPETSDEPKSVQRIALSEFEAGEKRGARLLGDNIELVRNVRVRLTVSVGRCELTIKDLFELKENAVLTLDKDTREPVDILLDDKVVARGTLVAVEDSFGVQITEIVSA